MNKENTAVFIGHSECYGVTSEQIKEAVVSLINKGVTEFLSGGQGGFDRLCGRCVYELKKEYPKEYQHLDNWEQLYDKSKFAEQLEKMIKNHDANHGITWLTIEEYLYQCKKE